MTSCRIGTHMQAVFRTLDLAQAAGLDEVGFHLRV
jgi:hypothetical protein